MSLARVPSIFDNDFPEIGANLSNVKYKERGMIGIVMSNGAQKDMYIGDDDVYVIAVRKLLKTAKNVLKNPKGKSDFTFTETAGDDMMFSVITFTMTLKRVVPDPRVPLQGALTQYSVRINSTMKGEKKTWAVRPVYVHDTFDNIVVPPGP